MRSLVCDGRGTIDLMSTKRKRGTRSSGANEPRELMREHARRLRRERQAVGAFLRAAWDHPAAGSLMLADREGAAKSGDLETCRARQDVLERTVQLSDRLVASVLNHTLALEECLSATIVPHYAPMTLARSLLDAAVQFCYLTDADADASVRLIRAAALLLDSAREEVTAVRHMRQSVVPGVLGRVQRAEQKLEAQIISAGMEVCRPAKSRASLRWPGGRHVNLGVSVTAEQEKYVPGIDSSYRVGSGAAHAMEWMLHDPADEPARVYMACGAADPALAALSALADRAGRYTGHDALSVCDRIADERRALVGRSLALARSGFQSIPRHTDEAGLGSALD
jgi:hypothetical protein